MNLRTQFFPSCLVSSAGQFRFNTDLFSGRVTSVQTCAFFFANVPKTELLMHICVTAVFSDAVNDWAVILFVA
jgi:hypothetical protein